jgi:hypothetical protein
VRRGSGIAGDPQITRSQRGRGAEIGGTVPMWQWIGDEGATTFSYCPADRAQMSRQNTLTGRRCPADQCRPGGDVPRINANGDRAEAARRPRSPRSRDEELL